MFRARFFRRFQVCNFTTIRVGFDVKSPRSMTNFVINSLNHLDTKLCLAILQGTPGNDSAASIPNCQWLIDLVKQWTANKSLIFPVHISNPHAHAKNMRSGVKRSKLNVSDMSSTMVEDICKEFELLAKKAAKHQSVKPKPARSLAYFKFGASYLYIVLVVNKEIY